SAQTGVPTSTTLWCSSGLICSPRWLPAANISSMWLFSSRVRGSTSWNSSSMPRVNWGMGRALAGLDQERRHLAAAGAHVGQGGGGERGEEALHLALEEEGVQAEDEVAEAEAPLADLGERLAARLHLLLHHEGAAQGLGQGGRPVGLARLPADVDALA